MNTKRNRFGLALCAALAILVGTATMAQAGQTGPTPGGANNFIGQVYIEYYNNGIPSNILTTVPVSGSTYITCRQSILSYRNNQIVYVGGVPKRVYMFHGFSDCGYGAPSFPDDL